MSSHCRQTEPPDPEVPETGAVFTFGRAKYAAENAPNKFWIKKDEVSHHYRAEREIETRKAVFDTHVGDGMRVSLASVTGTNSNSCLPLTASATTTGGEREINDIFRGSIQKEVISDFKVKTIFCQKIRVSI
jgi:hypothetical protein